MEASSLVSALEQARDLRQFRRLLAQNLRIDGFGDAYFARVAQLLGEDLGLLRRLTRDVDAVLAAADDRAPILRAQAVRYRVDGQWKQAAVACQAAGRSKQDPIQKLAFQTGAVDSLARSGDVDGAVALGKRLSGRLVKLNQPGLAGRVQLNVGNALLWQDRYREARAWLDRAVDNLGDSFPVEAASARLGLSTSELYGGSALRAGEVALLAQQAFESLELPLYVDLCRVNIAQSLLLTGRADEAVPILLALRPHFESSPFDRGRTEEFLGDAFARLNLSAEAGDAYQSALLVYPKVDALNRANALLGWASVSLAEGRNEEADRQATLARNVYRRLGNKVWEAAALLTKAEARGLGRSRTLISNALDLLQSAGSPILLAKAKLDWAEANLARLPSADLLKLTSEASRLIAKAGAIGLAWRPHALSARIHTGNARLKSYRTMLDRILEARLLTQSSTARASFLGDKSDAIRTYLGELLRRGRTIDIEEALDVIRRSRAGALIDEILNAQGGLSEDQRRELDLLRAELQQSGETNGGGARQRVDLSQAQLTTLQRRWRETSWDLLTLAESKAPPNSSQQESVVFVEADGEYYAIWRGHSHRLGLTAHELKTRLRWLEFDLLAPMAIRNTAADALDAPLRELAAVLLGRFELDTVRSITLCPDGDLWRAPWPALVAALGWKAEVTLLGSPSFDHHADSKKLTKKPRAMLWWGEAPDLPNLRNEAETFLEQFPDAKICRSMKDVRSSWNDSVDILHVACHAKFVHRSPMFSFLEFGDGRVHATEIARSPLKVGMTVLSACETGVLSLAFRDEPEGLARAFLARGSGAVMASAWPLDDEAAGTMAKPFYEHLSHGETIGRSMASAREVTRQQTPHPYFWGAFVLFGGYEA